MATFQEMSGVLYWKNLVHVSEFIFISQPSFEEVTVYVFASGGRYISSVIRCYLLDDAIDEEDSEHA